MGKIIKKIKSGLFGKTKPQPEDYKGHYNYKHGLELKESGDYYEAYLSFLKEVEECPQNGYAFYQMADLCYGSQKLGLALTATTEAIAVLSHDKDYLYESYSLRAQINRDLGKEQEMLSDLDAAISLKPEKEGLYFMRAGYYSEQEDYEKSDADYRKYAELVPGCPYPLAGLGRNLLKQGLADEAKKMFENCTSLAPYYEIAYAFLGQCKFELGDILGCIEDCLTCLSYDPRNQLAETLLLDSVANKDFKLLEVKLKNRMLQDPHNDKWAMLLALSYSKKKEWYKAIRMWNEAYNINPNPTYLDYMSEEFEWVGDFRHAQSCLRQALESAGDDYDLRVKLAEMLLNEARYEEALRELEICRQQRLDDPRVLTKLSIAYRMLDRYEESLDCAQMAVLLVSDTDIAKAWLSLALIHERMGNTDKRDEALEKAASLETSEYANMIVLALLGRSDEALESLRNDPEDLRNCYNLMIEATVLAIANRIDEAAEVLQKSFQLGNCYFEPIMRDDIFKHLHAIPNLKEQIDYWKAKADQEHEEKYREIFGCEKTNQ